MTLISPYQLYRTLTSPISRHITFILHSWGITLHHIKPISRTPQPYYNIAPPYNTPSLSYHIKLNIITMKRHTYIAPKSHTSRHITLNITSYSYHTIPRLHRERHSHITLYHHITSHHFHITSQHITFVSQPYHSHITSHYFHTTWQLYQLVPRLHQKLHTHMASISRYITPLLCHFAFIPHRP